MPRKPIDYQKTIIYKFICDDNNVTDTYVGHTTNFTNRKKSHKCNCNNAKSKSYHLKVYQSMREHGGWSNWKMVVIEKYPCSDVFEAKARETYWYETLNPNLNVHFPQRTNQQYREDNKEKLAEQSKLYYENNKEKKQIYRETHKKEINEYHRQNYINKKETIMSIRSEPYNCECGSCVRKGDVAKHFKTMKHNTYINRLNANKS